MLCAWQCAQGAVARAPVRHACVPGVPPAPRKGGKDARLRVCPHDISTGNGQHHLLSQHKVRRAERLFQHCARAPLLPLQGAQRVHVREAPQERVGAVASVRSLGGVHARLHVCKDARRHARASALTLYPAELNPKP